MFESRWVQNCKGLGIGRRTSWTPECYWHDGGTHLGALCRRDNRTKAVARTLLQAFSVGRLSGVRRRFGELGRRKNRRLRRQSTLRHRTSQKGSRCGLSVVLGARGCDLLTLLNCLALLRRLGPAKCLYRVSKLKGLTRDFIEKIHLFKF